MTIREKLLQAVERYALLDRGDHVLVGVSGGQDSLTLLSELHALAPQLRIELVVAHLHHGLRGEAADADQQHVGELAAQLGLLFAAERTDVAGLAEAEKIGLEEAGRRSRYRFFDRAADAHGCNKIAVAHTATDRAETLLMNLFRGAGLHGLRSIPPRRDRIIRPLILVSRQETADYCRTSGLRVRLDSTNLEPTPLRNRVRAELLPQLERGYGPGIETALCRAAEHVLAEIEWTEPLVAQGLAGARVSEGLSLAALQEMAPGLRHRVLRHYLAEAGHQPTDVSQERWEALEAFIERGRTGRRLELSSSLGVELEYNVLRVEEREEAEEGWTGIIELHVPGQVTLPGGTLVEAQTSSERPNEYPPAEAHQAVMDATKAGDLMLLRRARPGDRFVPLGMTGEKKLQDFFVDNKVPSRDRHPLVVTRTDGQILWIVGQRMAEIARADDNGRRFVTLKVSRD